MRASGLVISGLLGLLLAIPAGLTTAQSPSVVPSPSVARAVPVVGPDGMTGPPSPAIGPDWTQVLDRRLEVLHAQVAACGEGFTAMAFGHDRKVRAHGFVWVSADGSRWQPGEELRPRVDGIPRLHSAVTRSA